MHALRNGLDRVAIWCLYAAAATMAVMMFHVAADVIAKRLVGAPIKGTLEMVSLYYMVAVVFLPLGMVQRNREHIFIELFTQRLDRRWIRVLDTFALLLTLALAAVLLWKSIEVALEKTAIGEISQNMDFQMPVWQGRWLPVIGFGLTFANAALFFVSEVVSIATGRESQVPDKHSDDEREGM